jgi:uncharacterized protein YfcZ (UPF0381/DUF406 family)
MILVGDNMDDRLETIKVELKLPYKARCIVPSDITWLVTEVDKLRKQVQFYSTSHIGELEIEQLAEFAKDLEEDMQRMTVMLKEVEEMIQIKQEEVPRENNPCP